MNSRLLLSLSVRACVIAGMEPGGVQDKPENLRVGLSGPAGEPVEEKEHEDSAKEGVEEDRSEGRARSAPPVGRLGTRSPWSQNLPSTVIGNIGKGKSKKRLKK
jgi:hypothetical protein